METITEVIMEYDKFSFFLKQVNFPTFFTIFFLIICWLSRRYSKTKGFWKKLYVYGYIFLFSLLATILGPMIDYCLRFNILISIFLLILGVFSIAFLALLGLFID